ncbi:unnamed protein product [Camellia sinensis]
MANTHVNVHQDLKDVKLWQVHTLLKGLEKIAASADIPMLVCGDFNAVPGSAPHALLAIGKVDPMHPDLAVDPLGILRPASKLAHQLPLVSAYSSFARMGVGLGLEQHRRRMDPTTNEPLFTNCTRDFIGTLDYIFYSVENVGCKYGDKSIDLSCENESDMTRTGTTTADQLLPKERTDSSEFQSKDQYDSHQSSVCNVIPQTTQQESLTKSSEEANQCQSPLFLHLSFNINATKKVLIHSISRELFDGRGFVG